MSLNKVENIELPEITEIDLFVSLLDTMGIKAEVEDQKDEWISLKFYNQETVVNLMQIAATEHFIKDAGCGIDSLFQALTETGIWVNHYDLASVDIKPRGFLFTGKIDVKITYEFERSEFERLNRLLMELSM